MNQLSEIQLDEFKAVTIQKNSEIINRRGIIFHHNNASPHVSMSILDFEWDVLSHLSYSTDFALSDYYLFLFKKFFLEKKYDSLEALKREPSRQLIFRQ